MSSEKGEKEERNEQNSNQAPSVSLSLFSRAILFLFVEKGNDGTNRRGGCNYRLVRPMIIASARRTREIDLVLPSMIETRTYDLVRPLLAGREAPPSKLIFFSPRRPTWQAFFARCHRSALDVRLASLETRPKLAGVSHWRASTHQMVT